MDLATTSYHSLTPAKRPFSEDLEPHATTPPTHEQRVQPSAVHAPASPRSMGSSDTLRPTALPNGASRQASPALSSLSSLSSISSTLPPFNFDGAAQSSEQATSNGQPTSQPPANPAKRRKLTPAEQEQRRLEKEQKEREKAEQRTKREEEKQVKDEERRQKNEVKEEKRRERDLEKQRKEEEKRKVEEEKEKKERTQKRINAFFVKPKESSITSGTAGKGPCAVDEPGSLTPRDGSATPPAAKSDYHHTFLPYALPSNTTWAASSIFSWDKEAVLHVQKTLDKEADAANEKHFYPEATLTEMFEPCGTESRSHVVYESVKEIIKRLTNSGSNSIDLAESQSGNPLEALQRIPMRYIHFHEDIRPPYIGTYTKIGLKPLSRACRNPFITIRQDTNYEEDSEAEWEDDDGEDLQSEGESELESNDGADEMDDFLDDEDSEVQAAKKKNLPVDLEPICSGLCWEFPKGASLDSKYGATKFGQYKLALLQDCLKLPIDPFSSSYWLEPESDAKSTSKQSVLNMQPPRQPLQSRPSIFLNSISAPAIVLGNSPNAKPSKAPAQKPPPRLLAGTELADFKDAVAGSEHTKVGLLAILKKQFPKVPNTVLSDTLSTYAERQGEKEAEKRWRIKDVP